MTTFVPPPAPALTRAELTTFRLLRLRARYSVCRDLFDDKELAHLRFIRWLYQTGRLAS